MEAYGPWKGKPQRRTTQGSLCRRGNWGLRSDKRCLGSTGSRWLSSSQLQDWCPGLEANLCHGPSEGYLTFHFVGVERGLRQSLIQGPWDREWWEKSFTWLQIYRALQCPSWEPGAREVSTQNRTIHRLPVTLGSMPGQLPRRWTAWHKSGRRQKPFGVAHGWGNPTVLSSRWPLYVDPASLGTRGWWVSPRAPFRVTRRAFARQQGVWATPLSPWAAPLLWPLFHRLEHWTSWTYSLKHFSAVMFCVSGTENVLCTLHDTVGQAVKLEYSIPFS